MEKGGGGWQLKYINKIFILYAEVSFEFTYLWNKFDYIQNRKFFNYYAIENSTYEKTEIGARLLIMPRYAS